MKFSVLILILYSNQIIACCSQNQGICGDKCCDGAVFSKIDCGHRFVELPTVVVPTLEIAKDSVKSPSKWLYVWTDPNTSKSHLSSKFPPWYRNPLYPENYPRVLVYDEYNRLIDDTGTKTDEKKEYQLRQQAITNLRQQEQYNKILAKKVSKKAKQKRLKYLISQWNKTGVISKEMQNLLAEQVTNKNVTMAMTEKQVIQVWGKPDSYIEEISNGKTNKTLIYKQNQVTLIDSFVKAIRIKE
ncbi:hypothetical protein QUF74_00285 [Candidatus Halobeggiatoa sp. HSG11]|nr:hypothetical protein [Candidatus Halobeggiatoa sp. HSG11]